MDFKELKGVSGRSTLFLTSKNEVKKMAANQLLNAFKCIECVDSESGVSGGQPYGLLETKEGCIFRTSQFKKNEDFISIENGFVKECDSEWYDIAYIYIRLNGIIYDGWSEKRYFPRKLYNDIVKLIQHFEKNSITRTKQLEDCVARIMNDVTL